MKHGYIGRTKSTPGKPIDKDVQAIINALISLEKRFWQPEIRKHTNMMWEQAGKVHEEVSWVQHCLDGRKQVDHTLQ